MAYFATAPTFAAPAPAMDTFVPSDNLLSKFTSSDYFINPLDDDALTRADNILLACNDTEPESWVWQGFVSGEVDEESLAASSEAEVSPHEGGDSKGWIKFTVFLVASSLWHICPGIPRRVRLCKEVWF